MKKVLFIEGWHEAVRNSINQLLKQRYDYDIKILLRKDYSDDPLIKDFLNRNKVDYEACDKDEPNAIYELGVDILAKGSVDILFAGASITHFDFLPILFHGLKVKRKSNLLTSFAVLNFANSHRKVFIMDPTVVTDADDDELCEMVISVAKAVKSQLKQAKVALLSHTTAIQAPQRETKQNRVISLLKKALRDRPNEAQFDLIEFPIQLDAALYTEAANIKLPEPIDDPLKLPNLLVLPDITTANILYKSFELGDPKFTITSPILWRAPRKGEVGLLPRTTTPSQIIRSLDILSRLVDFRRNNEN